MRAYEVGAALRFIVNDIDLILGDHYSGMTEDRIKALPAYSRLTSLIYLDMDGEEIASPEQIIERAKAYGPGPDPCTDRQMGSRLPPREEPGLSE